MLMKKGAARTGCAESDNENEGRGLKVGVTVSASGSQLSFPSCESDSRPNADGSASSFATASFAANSAYQQLYEAQALHDLNSNVSNAERTSAFTERIPRVAYPVLCCLQGGSGHTYPSEAQPTYSPAYLPTYEAAAASLLEQQQCIHAVPRTKSSSPPAYMASSQGQSSSHKAGRPVVPFRSRQYQMFDAAQASFNTPSLRYAAACEYVSHDSLAPAVAFEPSSRGPWQYLGQSVSAWSRISWPSVPPWQGRSLWCQCSVPRRVTRLGCLLTMSRAAHWRLPIRYAMCFAHMLVSRREQYNYSACPGARHLVRSYDEPLGASVCDSGCLSVRFSNRLLFNAS
uniref:Uncharacterized protein n=1 Tax=Chrysotila carterae TaxID=13221 RepID=A0A6T0EK79_CHRCT|mmetsp:Transcript_5762/g.12586  ORF Transcript_5762/g.12586 Transcript_5762/m.12586 type:complete len:343 (-) Transcript_5762:251-1279(-)